MVFGGEQTVKTPAGEISSIGSLFALEGADQVVALYMLLINSKLCPAELALSCSAALHLRLLSSGGTHPLDIK